MTLTPALIEWLAPINASLNLLTTLLLVLGYIAVRKHAIHWHRRLMLSALGSSALFLAGYLTRMIVQGAHRFPDVGWLRTAYLVLLASHTVLAALVVPLVLRAAYLALRGRFSSHRKVARVTWPIWLYVSVTGIVVYVMLYHVAPLLMHVTQ